MGGLDELRFDAIGTIVVDVPGGGQQDIAIERIGVVLFVELIAKPILSWHAYYTPEVTPADLRATLQGSLTPGEPWTFSIPGVQYGSPDAGFPHALIALLRYHPVAILMLDNFSSHQEQQILADIADVLGCFINFGPVGAWYRRAHLERKIKHFLEQCAQRLPSTTGSDPTDPRRDDPVTTAVKYRIRWSHLLQLIEATVAQMNAEPSEAIGLLSPIQLLRQVVTDPATGFSPRPMPLERQHAKCIKLTWIVVTVRGSLKNGRRPFFVIDRTRYTNKALAHTWELIGKQLLIGIDEDDMRVVRGAVFGSGVDIGELEAQGAWAKTPHTRRQRKEINRLLDRKVLALPQGIDPIPAYLDYLRAQAITQSASRTKQPRVSRAATKLAGAEAVNGERPPVSDPPPAAHSMVVPSAPDPRMSNPTEVPEAGDLRELLKRGKRWTNGRSKKHGK